MKNYASREAPALHQGFPICLCVSVSMRVSDLLRPNAQHCTP